MTFLLVLVSLSVVGPIVAARLRLPSAVVLILAGIAVGPAGLGVVRDTQTIAFVAELGFLVLMFIAGMEMDFSAIRAGGLRVLGLPTLAAVGSLLAAFATSRWLGLSMIHVLVLSATSVGMPLAILHETGQLKTNLGRQVMLFASVGEFVSILALTGYELSVRVGLSVHLVTELVKLTGLFAISALVIRWSRALVWWYPRPFRRMVAGHDVAEMGVRVGLLLMFAFVVLTSILGVEAILGAFIAGSLLAFVLNEKSVLEAKVAALGNGLFIPIFFTVVGVRFRTSDVTPRAIEHALLLIGVAGLVKLASTLVFATRSLRFGERVAAWSLLSAPLTLVVAISAVGERVGVVSPDDAATFILVGLGLSVLFPTLFRLLVARITGPDALEPGYQASLPDAVEPRS